MNLTLNSLKTRLGLISLALALALIFGLACSGSEATPTPAPTAAPTPTATSAATFAKPDLLTETTWLSQHLNDANLRIIDARTAKEYEAGHIAGAVNVPVEDTFNPTGPKQMAGPAEQIERVFGEKGISDDTRVVVYDNGKETKAPRVFWTLEYFGNNKASVLNGGFKKWQSEGLATATEATKPAPVKFNSNIKPNLFASKEAVLAAINKPGFSIVDTRSPQEYRGEDLRTKRGGHIPGAVNINWVDLFTTGDVPVLKTPAELKKMYEDAGVTRDKEIIVHCQTGQRSAVNYLTLRLLGYGKVSNYDGSWQEWGNDADTPIEK